MESTLAESLETARREFDDEMAPLGLSSETLADAWLDARERVIQDRNATNRRMLAETQDAAEAKQTAAVNTTRALFREMVDSRPADLALSYRQMFGSKATDEAVETWLGPDLLAEVKVAIAAQPHKKVWKGDKLVNLQGAKKDRTDQPYWDQIPAGVRAAVIRGQLRDIDGTVAAVIWQHNRRVYRAKKDKTQRINIPEMARLVGRDRDTVWRSVRRLLASGEMELASTGQGRQDGAIYRFPSRSELGNTAA